MGPSEIISEKRARNVCLAGLVIQIILTVLLMLLHMANQSMATFATSLYLLGGIFIWIPLIIIHHQRRLVVEESLESERLRRERETNGSGALFELEQEEFLIQQRRLNWMYRWLLSSFVFLTVIYLLGCVFLFWPSSLTLQSIRQGDWEPVKHVSLSMFFVAGVAFVAFLFSRYISGMSRDPALRMLKAGANYLFGNSLVCLALIICLSLVESMMPIPERVLAYAEFVLFAVLAVEFVVNYVLDLYRPKVAGEVPRPAFESRLLGLVGEPSGIAKSIAEAFNYQFGFEVSATWFYKMLERAVVPLIALSVVVLIGMTSFVLVDANELAVKERFGRPVSREPLGPGLHFKAPWPIESVRDTKVNVGIINEIVIGEIRGTDQGDVEEEAGQKVICWTDDHKSVPFVDLLVATPTRRGLSGGGKVQDQRSTGSAVAVSILRVSMPVQYRVRKDPDGLFNYLYKYADPETMLRDIAYRELVKKAVHFDYQGIMGSQREMVAADLARLIQQKCNEMGLGIEILYVGLQDVHPPHESDVAATFQKVATAEQEKYRLIQEAEIEETTKLNEVAGDVERAKAIDEKVREWASTDPADIYKRAEIERERRRLVLGDLTTDPPLYPVRGAAGQRLAEARAKALKAVQAAAGKARNFDLELAAFEASPRLYRMRKIIETLSAELDGVRKYVVMVDPDTTKVIIEVDERDTGGLEITGPSEQ